MKKGRCRICHTVSDEPVIRPCACRGSIGLAHESCLRHWLLRQQSMKCEICGSKFRITKVYRAGQSPKGLWARASGLQRIGLVFQLMWRLACRGSASLLRTSLFGTIWLFCVPFFLQWLVGIHKEQILPNDSAPATGLEAMDTLSEQPSSVELAEHVLTWVALLPDRVVAADWSTIGQKWIIGMACCGVAIVILLIQIMWFEWCNEHMDLFPELIPGEIAEAAPVMENVPLEGEGGEREEGEEDQAEEEEADDGDDEDPDSSASDEDPPAAKNKGPKEAVEEPKKNDDTVEADKVPEDSKENKDREDEPPAAKSDTEVENGEDAQAREPEPEASEAAAGREPPYPQSTNAESAAMPSDLQVSEEEMGTVFGIIREHLKEEHPEIEHAEERDIRVAEIFGLAGPVSYGVLFVPIFLFLVWVNLAFTTWIPQKSGEFATWALLPSLSYASEAIPIEGWADEFVDECKKWIAMLGYQLLGVCPIETLSPIRDVSAPIGTIVNATSVPSIAMRAILWVWGVIVLNVVGVRLSNWLPHMLRKAVLFMSLLTKLVMTQLVHLGMVPLLTGLMVPFLLHGYMATTESIANGLHPELTPGPTNVSSNTTLSPLECALARLPPLDIGLCATNYSAVDAASRNGTTGTFAREPSITEVAAALAILYRHRSELTPDQLFVTQRCQALSETCGTACDPIVQESIAFATGPTAWWRFVMGTVIETIPIFSDGLTMLGAFVMGMVIQLVVGSNIAEWRMNVHVKLLWPIYIDRPEEVGVESIVQASTLRLCFAVLRGLFMNACGIAFVLRPSLRVVRSVVPGALPIIPYGQTWLAPVALNTMIGFLNTFHIGWRLVGDIVAEDGERQVSFLGLWSQMVKATHKFMFEHVGNELDVTSYLRAGNVPKAREDISFPMRLTLFGFLYWLGSVAASCVFHFVCVAGLILLSGAMAFQPSTVSTVTPMDATNDTLTTNATNSTGLPWYTASSESMPTVDENLSPWAMLVTLEVAFWLYFTITTANGPIRRAVSKWLSLHDNPLEWIRFQQLKVCVGIQCKASAVHFQVDGQPPSVIRSFRVLGGSTFTVDGPLATAVLATPRIADSMSEDARAALTALVAPEGRWTFDAHGHLMWYRDGAEKTILSKEMFREWYTAFSKLADLPHPLVVLLCSPILVVSQMLVLLFLVPLAVGHFPAAMITAHWLTPEGSCLIGAERATLVLSFLIGGVLLLLDSGLLIFCGRCALPKQFYWQYLWLSKTHVLGTSIKAPLVSVSQFLGSFHGLLVTLAFIAGRHAELISPSWMAAALGVVAAALGTAVGVIAAIAAAKNWIKKKPVAPVEVNDDEPSNEPSFTADAQTAADNSDEVPHREPEGSPLNLVASPARRVATLDDLNAALPARWLAPTVDAAAVPPEPPGEPPVQPAAAPTGVQQMVRGVRGMMDTFNSRLGSLVESLHDDANLIDIKIHDFTPL